MGFGCEGWEGRQKELELGVKLDEVMSSICMLLELVAQAVEDAGAERKRLEWPAEFDTARAERGYGSSMDNHPLSWLVPSNATDCDSTPTVSSLTKS